MAAYTYGQPPSYPPQAPPSYPPQPIQAQFGQPPPYPPSSAQAPPSCPPQPVQAPPSYPPQPPHAQFGRNQPMLPEQPVQAQDYPYPAPQIQQHNFIATPQQFTISRNSIRSTGTGQVICTVSWSERGIVVARPEDVNAVVGSIKTSNWSGKVKLSINCRETSLRGDDTSPLTQAGEYHFESPMAHGGKFFWFAKEKSFWSSKMTLTMKDARHHGNTVAHIQNHTPNIMMPGMNQATIDEVMVSAIGMLEIIGED